MREIYDMDGNGDVDRASRNVEREALVYVVALMEEADASPLDLQRRNSAAIAGARLWSRLLEDLANPENRLNPELRGQLISIGIAVLRSIDERMREKTGHSSTQ